MNDAFVTARVPSALKEQVNTILKDMGVTQSELVNAAYNYVLRVGHIPEVDDISSGRRVLSPDMAKELAARMERISFEAPESWQTRTSEELLDEAREERLKEKGLL